MMKRLKTLCWVAVMGACFVTAGFATNNCNPNSSLPCLTATGDNTSGLTMGGVYTSPYQFSITVGGSTQAGILLSCDDFLTDINFGDMWNATITSLSQLPALEVNGPTNIVKMDHTTTAHQQLLDYATVAVLANELIQQQNLPGGFGTVTAGELSFAMWAVFDPPSLNNLAGTQYTQALADLTGAQGVASNAINTGNLASLPNILIYTPAPNQGVSQEFIGIPVSADEPPSIALLAIDLFAVLSVIVFVRRRFASTVA